MPMAIRTTSNHAVMDDVVESSDPDLESMGFIEMTHSTDGRPVVYIIAKNFQPKGVKWSRILRYCNLSYTVINLSDRNRYGSKPACMPLIL